jgi:hypothetical protein
MIVFQKKLELSESLATEVSHHTTQTEFEKVFKKLNGDQDNI